MKKEGKYFLNDHFTDGWNLNEKVRYRYENKFMVIKYIGTRERECAREWKGRYEIKVPVFLETL